MVYIDDGIKAKQWLQMKFNDDLSDIRREEYGYYKYYVEKFISSYFSKQRVIGKNILDFGCGPGYFSVILANSGANIIGIDKCRYLIEKAQEHKIRLNLENVDFYHTDLNSYSLTYNKDKYDYILAIDTIVSLDYGRLVHNHNQVVEIFRGVHKLLKEDGRFFIIESHPFFGQLFMTAYSSEGGENYYKSNYSYKVEHKENNYPHHWFTLDELTKATYESGLVIRRIHEPDPSIELKNEDKNTYTFRIKHPAMIVYEISKLNT